MAKVDTKAARIKRHRRVRAKVKGTEARPRLCVFRSLNNIYAQIVDDTKGRTLVTASTLDPELKSELEGKPKTVRAGLVGSTLAKRAIGAGITEVSFDRGGYRYHGRVKVLADGARQGGLKF